MSTRTCAAFALAGLGVAVAAFGLADHAWASGFAVLFLAIGGAGMLVGGAATGHWLRSTSPSRTRNRRR